MARRGRGRLQMTVDENVSVKLRAEGVALRGPAVARVLHEGAVVLRAAAAAAVPVEDTGQLKRGIYAASQAHDEFRPLVRPRNGQRLNVPLKFAPVRRQAVVVNSVFYTRWVERGRQARGTQDVLRPGEKRARRTVGVQKRGRKRGRPFFMRAIRGAKAAAEAKVQRGLVLLVERTWEK